MADLLAFAASMSRPTPERVNPPPPTPPAPVPAPVMRNCVICGQPFVAGRLKVTCGHPECRRALCRAKERNREHAERATVSDITAAQEAEMRRKARNCPLCGVRMTSEPLLPNSKELDHILPINQGGTHTLGNVRIICRRDNQARPRDGSDFAGQLTLWAQGPDVPVGRQRATPERTTCRKGLHPWIPANIVTWADGKHCRSCVIAAEVRCGKRQPLRQCGCGAMFPAPGRAFMCPDCTAAAAKRAAELHAGGGLTWAEVTRQVGYQSGEGARFAAKRIGYTARTARPMAA